MPPRNLFRIGRVARRPDEDVEGKCCIGGSSRWQDIEVNIYELGVVVDERRAAPSGLRRFATDEMPIYHAYKKTLVDPAGSSLNERIVSMLQVDGPHAVSDYYEEGDVRYALRASAYHVDRMVELYARTTTLFEDLHPVGTASRGNTSGDEVYFEFDAFVTSARRVYEHLRRLLWKHFSGKGNSPVTFAKLVGAIPDLPPELRQSLTKSWHTTGTILKHYRDCISHFVPLDPGSHTSWLEPRDGRWTMTVRIPANPESKSRRMFEFDGGPDALTYSYESLCHLVDLSEEASAAVGL